MKLFTVIAVSVALFGVSLGDEEKSEEKKARIINFYKCIACAEDNTVKEEFMKCKELKPEKCKKIAEECKAKIMPEATTPEARFEAICKSEHGEDEKLYDCIMKDEYKKDLTDDEKTQLKEYIKCAKALNKKFCNN